MFESHLKHPLMKGFVLIFLEISQANHAEVREVYETLPSDLDRYVDHLLIRGV